MQDISGVSADDALKKLILGNKQYVLYSKHGDFSLKKCTQTAKEGQHPYAIVVCCADSRTIPEVIFGAGIGELFVVRVAGNVVKETQLASIEYAVEHLGCKLIVVLGHSDCGAVTAAFNGVEGNYVNAIINEIKQAIDGEKSLADSITKNIANSVNIIKNAFPQVATHAALYQLNSGRVVFLENL